MTSKIGVFCPTLNVYGGGEFVAIAIANTLAQHGHNVILFSADQIDPTAIKDYFGETLHRNIQTLPQHTNFAPRSLADFYQTIVHSYIAKNRSHIFIDAFSNCVYPWSDITYIHFPYLNRFSFKANFPYLKRPHLTQAGTLPYVIFEKNLVDYKKRLVLANSQYTANEIKRYSNNNAQVLYPPFPSTITQTKNFAKDSDKLVVTVSRLDANKLLDRIPKIAAQTDREIKFAVVGRLCSKLTLAYLESVVRRQGLEDRVKFFPNASVESKADLLKRAKVYLHTMEGEHFGISIAEAMAFGCIPVVPDSGGMKEFVPKPNRYTTIEQAAKKIAEEISNWTPEKSREIAESVSQFSLENFSKKFMDIFNGHFGGAEFS